MVLGNKEVGRVFPAEGKDQSLPSSWIFAYLQAVSEKNTTKKGLSPPAINPIQDGESEELSTLKFFTYILQCWNLTELYLT